MSEFTEKERIDTETGEKYLSNIDELIALDPRFKQCRTPDCDNETVIVVPGEREQAPPFQLKYEAFCRPCWKISADVTVSLLDLKFAEMGFWPSPLDEGGSV